MNDSFEGVGFIKVFRRTTPGCLISEAFPLRDCTLPETCPEACTTKVISRLNYCKATNMLTLSLVQK